MVKQLTKPCKKCGGLEAGTNRGCKYCHDEKIKEWRIVNKERYNLGVNQWNKNNRDSVNDYYRTHRKNNMFSEMFVKKAIRDLKIFRSMLLSFDDIPPELIEIKRLQMQLHHAIKERERLLLEAQKQTNRENYG